MILFFRLPNTSYHVSTSSLPRSAILGQCQCLYNGFHSLLHTTISLFCKTTLLLLMMVELVMVELVSNYLSHSALYSELNFLWITASLFAASVGYIVQQLQPWTVQRSQTRFPSLPCWCRSGRDTRPGCYPLPRCYLPAAAGFIFTGIITLTPLTASLPVDTKLPACTVSKLILNRATSAHMSETSFIFPI